MLTPPFYMNSFNLCQSTLNRYSFAIHKQTADCSPYLQPFLFPIVATSNATILEEAGGISMLSPLQITVWVTKRLLQKHAIHYSLLALAIMQSLKFQLGKLLNPCDLDEQLCTPNSLSKQFTRNPQSTKGTLGLQIDQ